MRKFVVCYVHSVAPHRCIPKLIVEGVPDGESLDWTTLEAVGYKVRDYGMLGANHRIFPADKLPSDARYAIRRGEVERITYDELICKATSPV